MNPDEKNMLARALKLAEENNELLVKINRRARMGNILQVLYWLLIIGLSFGAYYFIQPYINWLASALGGSSTPSSTSLNIEGLQDLVKAFQNK